MKVPRKFEAVIYRTLVVRVGHLTLYTWFRDHV